MRDDERGMVTAFVTIFVVALLFVIGLVLDGGYVLAAKREAANVAAQAARAGAQQLDVGRLRRDDVDALDPVAAEQAAEAFLERVGHEGDATADEESVTVTVQVKRKLLILGIGGLGPEVTVHGTGEARGVQGG